MNEKEVKIEENNINQSNIAKREEEILKFWQENKIFEKTLAKKSSKGEFIFYDGPPFATGLPHYGHILAGTIKDAIPRYKTMCGFRVSRRWGWDCHGLPVENLIEKELGLKTKKDIEIYGVGKFNQKAKESVMLYADEWRRIIPRLGRFVDMENDYRTMDTSYTESVWWAFKTLYDKGLLYEGFKSMHICPRCETTLSNFEVTQGYKEITDISVYAKFKLKSEKDTYFLAWTTTPWTLPGNTALAVGKDIDYIKVKGNDAYYILAKERLNAVFKNEASKILEEFKGEELIGKEYEPLFDYYFKDLKLKNRENGWKVYGASFVTTEDGTGIVHIAPAFGEDDYNLSLKENLPFIQHVGTNGAFRSEVLDWAGKQVKPKENHQEGDVEILRNLAGRGLLFEKEKYTHEYPHCWRCETSLLNYATSSWFVAVSKIKDKIISENERTKWIPEEIGKYRFGNWLKEARDWAISRSRFWGAPIPVWRCEKCQKVKVVENISDISQKARNNFWAMRHGEAENNTLNITSGELSSNYKLTKKGVEQVSGAVSGLRNKKIDYIFYSPLLRTKETAQMVGKELGLSDERLISDVRLKEVGFGKWEGKSVNDYHREVAHDCDICRFETNMDGVESFNDLRKRVGSFIKEIDEKYKDKNILIVSHDSPIWLLDAVSGGFSSKEAVSKRGGNKNVFVKNAEVLDIYYKTMPRNEIFEVDLHRPYIDEVILPCSCGGSMKRVKEVFDCWFESGSMPFASNKYPVCKKDFNPQRIFSFWPKGFPADFIAEGVDQTRGWFYSMLVLSVALFNKAPFKNVIVNGIILAENGEKMSKRLKNYPDLMSVVDKYGADVLRYYLLSSPAVKSEDLRFSEKGVDEISKKIFGRLENVVSFYELYREGASFSMGESHSFFVLDKWILARLADVFQVITKSLERYEIDRATRIIGDFVDDLSVWYLRRSRERFKGENTEDKKNALGTISFILFNLSKLMAPFTPFFAENLYKEIKIGKKESVHLEDWPFFLAKYEDAYLLKKMDKVRGIVSKALELRARANIKVRQPLLSLLIKRGGKDIKIEDNHELLKLIKEEINVKNISFDSSISEDLYLDTKITAELKEEGQVREIIRAIQDSRKNAGFTIKDEAVLILECDGPTKILIERNKGIITRSSILKDITFAFNQEGDKVDLGEGQFVKIKVLK